MKLCMAGVPLALVLALSILLTATPASADQAKGFSCPATGDPSEIVTCYNDDGSVKPGFPKVTPKPFSGGTDVNNDMKKDRLGSVTTDLAGNKIECWCLQKSSKTAQRFAYAFVPKGGGARQWFGGCFYPNGKNFLHCYGQVYVNGPNRGRFVEYTAVSQDNIEWGDDPNGPPTGTHDKHFRYYNSGTNKGKIQKFKTRGMWVLVGHDADGKAIYKYRTTSSTACPVTDPPSTPQGLFTVAFEPGELPEGGELVGPFNGVDEQPLAVIANTEAPPTYEYRLMVPPTFPANYEDLAGSVVTAGDVAIYPGDQFIATGSGITDAWVHPLAALPEVGGWELIEFDDEHATFQATTYAEPFPGEPFGPFVVISDALPGETTAAYVGEDVGMSLTTQGPAVFAVPLMAQPAAKGLERKE